MLGFNAITHLFQASLQLTKACKYMQPKVQPLWGGTSCSMDLLWYLLIGHIGSSLPKLPTCPLRTLILMQHKVQMDQHDHSSLHRASPFTHVLHRRWWFPSWFASAKITPWWRWGAWTPRLRLGERVSFTVTIPNSWFVTLLRQNDKIKRSQRHNWWMSTFCLFLLYCPNCRILPGFPCFVGCCVKFFWS